MSSVITGNLRLEVDELGLEVRLTFIQDPDGPEWQKEKILNLLEQKGIEQGIDQAALDNFPSEIEKHKGKPYSFTVARGIAPEEAEPARVKVEDLDIPEDLRKKAEKLINQSVPPNVFERIVEKVKIEQVVEKKGKLTFLSAKEEKEVKWQKKETKRPVQVDSIEKGRGYVKAGELVAKISPAKSAKNGRNIFGNELPAKTQKQKGIYLGEDLEEYGLEIKAEASGFFRYGENWIELFPFIKPDLSVYLSEDGKICLLDFTPGSATDALPSPETILQECRKLGAAPETFLPADEIIEILNRAVSSKESIKKKPISRTQDAEIRLTVCQDNKKALLFLKKGSSAGKQLSLKEIGDVLRNKGLKGMDTGKLKKDILEFHQGSETTLENYLLVEGREPTVGEDGFIKWSVPFLDQKEVNRLKEQFKSSGQMQEIKSLDEFPIEMIEDLAVVEERVNIALIEPPTAGEPGVDVFGTILPGKKGKKPRIKLYENLHLLKNEVVTVISGILEKATREDTVFLRVHPHSDHEIRVKISEDHMEAFVTLIPPEGTGTTILPENVIKEIQKQGIIKGINESLLSEAVSKAKSGQAVENFTFAQGLPPQHGKKRDLILHIKKASGQSVTLTEDGRADFKTQDKITSVPNNTLLVELAPQSEIKDGWDVTGKILPAKEADPIPLQIGKNVERREEDNGSVTFYSKTSGVLIYERNFLDVSHIHSVEGDVGLKTGNVKFAGSVRVKGCIQSGFSVISGSNIIVDDTVQGALLSAYESIHAQKGVKGEGRAILRAKKDIRSYFAEQALLLSVGDIYIKNACLRCLVKCNGTLYLQSDKGHIIGGSVRSKHGLIAINLGSERGVATEIRFGQDFLIADQIELEEKEIEKLKQKNQELDTSMRALDKSLNPDQSALAKIRKEKLYYLKITEKRIHRLFALRERFEEHFPSEIVVKGTVFPGVILESHGRKQEIKEKKKEIVFSFNSDRGRIEEKPLKG